MAQSMKHSDRQETSEPPQAVSEFPLAPGCSNCGKEDGKNMRRGRCGRCARHVRQYGIERVLEPPDKGFLRPRPTLHICEHLRVLTTTDTMFRYACIACGTKLTQGALPEGAEIVEFMVDDTAQEEAEAQVEPESQTEEEPYIMAVHAEQGITAENINEAVSRIQRERTEEQADQAEGQAEAEAKHALQPEESAMPRRERVVVSWTTALATVDLPETQEIEGEAGDYKGSPVRKVSTPLWLVHRQRTAYADAQAVALGTREWEHYTSQQKDAAARGDGEKDAAGITPDVQWVLDLAAQGAEAVAQAMQAGLLKRSAPNARRQTQGGRRQSPILADVPQDIQGQMRADRQTGMSYAKIDAKYGYAERKGHVAWTVCKAAA